MPIDQVRVASISAAVFAAVAATASIGAWLATQKTPPPASATAQISNGRMHIDSPISASGGSMTFRSQVTPWSCLPIPTSSTSLYTSCQTTASPASISAIGLYRMSGTNWVSAPTLGSVQGLSGTIPPITFCPRPANGDPGASAPTSPTTPYIVLSITGTTISLQVQNPMQAGLICSDAEEPTVSPSTRTPACPMALSTGSPTTFLAVQYFDPTCQVHGVPKTSGVDAPPVSLSPTVPTIPACEHPGWVTWVDGQSYLCRHGACWVSLE
jgi:hypothetical protein